MEFKNYEIICEDVSNFNQKFDVVIQNTPFGVKNTHADKMFLQKAFEVSDVVYSFHKRNTKDFVEKFSKDSGFKITHFWNFDFPLKQSPVFLLDY